MRLLPILLLISTSALAQEVKVYSFPSPQTARINDTLRADILPVQLSPFGFREMEITVEGEAVPLIDGTGKFSMVLGEESPWRVKVDASRGDTALLVLKGEVTYRRMLNADRAYSFEIKYPVIKPQIKVRHMGGLADDKAYMECKNPMQLEAGEVEDFTRYFQAMKIKNADWWVEDSVKGTFYLAPSEKYGTGYSDDWDDDFGDFSDEETNETRQFDPMISFGSPHHQDNVQVSVEPFSIKWMDKALYLRTDSLTGDTLTSLFRGIKILNPGFYEHYPDDAQFDIEVVGIEFLSIQEEDPTSIFKLRNDKGILTSFKPQGFQVDNLKDFDDLQVVINIYRINYRRERILFFERLRIPYSDLTRSTGRATYGY